MSPLARFGPYELISELGSGGHGTVHLARHVELDRLVALKRFDPRQASPRALERFRREAEALGRVRHPNIVLVHEVGFDGPAPYLVMERVRGGSLDDRLERGGPFDEREAAALVRTIAHAVAHLHQQGILHRDLKPANVLFEPGVGPKLTDLGTALLADDQRERLTRTGELVGTVAFMAPEQVEGEPDLIDARTDVYGLGATLHALLTGLPPFPGSSGVTAIARILTEPPAPRKHRRDLSPALAAIVTRCLAKDPDARYPSAEALALALGEFLVAPARGPSRRWPIALAVGLVALVGGGVAWRARTRREGATPAEASASATTPRLPSPDPEGGRVELPGWYLALPPARRPPLRPGLVPLAKEGCYRWEPDGSVLVWVPPGRFTMGSGWLEEHDLAAMLTGPVPNEAHEVELARGFFLGKYEVSWGQWSAWCSRTGRPEPSRRLHYEVVPEESTLVGTTFRDKTTGAPYFPGDDEPVIRITWRDARDYCDAHGLRLPSEEEWEWAARGPDPGRRYPWGNDPPVPELLNALDPADAYPYTAPVDSHLRGASPFGALNMAGNVKEYTADTWVVPPDHPFYESAGERRVITRGGNWANFHEQVFRVTLRLADHIDGAHSDGGFRVALDAAP